jgi:hypothetical protein
LKADDGLGRLLSSEHTFCLPEALPGINVPYFKQAGTLHFSCEEVFSSPAKILRKKRTRSKQNMYKSLMKVG